MKKLTKLLALGLAAALTFGMSVSAAESTDTGNTSAESEAAAEGVEVWYDANYEGYVVFDTLTAEDYDDAKAQVGEDEELVAAVDVVATGEGAVTIWIRSEKISADKEYVVLHGLADGTWERIIPSDVIDGEIEITLDSFSPIVVVEVLEKAGDDDDDDDDDDEKEEESDVVTSPKTGDVFSVAGFMAVVCLAGVAVSTKKANN